MKTMQSIFINIHNQCMDEDGNWIGVVNVTTASFDATAPITNSNKSLKALKSYRRNPIFLVI